MGGLLPETSSAHVENANVWGWTDEGGQLRPHQVRQVCQVVGCHLRHHLIQQILGQPIEFSYRHEITIKFPLISWLQHKTMQQPILDKQKLAIAYNKPWTNKR